MTNPTILSPSLFFVLEWYRLMEPCSYNHVITLLVDGKLITDNPISRMGQALGSTSVATIVINSYNKNFQHIFPEHAQLAQHVLMGDEPKRLVYYGALRGFGEFGLVVPADDGTHLFCLTLEYNKMADPRYQQAVLRSLDRVCRAAQIFVNQSLVPYLCAMFSMQATS